MKTILLSGCNPEQTSVLEALTEHYQPLAVYHLCKMDIRHCTSCDVCQVKTPGSCILKDDVEQILRQYLTSQKAVIVTPVQFGCCNSLTKRLIDRTQPLFLPMQNVYNGETRMMPHYAEYPNLDYIGLGDSLSDIQLQSFKQITQNCNLSMPGNEVTTYYYHTGDKFLRKI